jgi:hypothetical protein
VVATVDAALAKKGETLAALDRWKAEMPTEAEMLPKDKYTMFDRKAKRYRKGIHSAYLMKQHNLNYRFIFWGMSWTVLLTGYRTTKVDEGVATA